MNTPEANRTSHAAGTIKLADIVEIILRRRWYIIIPFCLSMIAGCCLILVLPKTYSASTLILVQPQKVPTDYVRSLVSSDIADRINTISQQILSRSNLIKIINEYNLFSGPKYEKMYREDKINLMRKQISVDLISKDRRAPADAFTISFKGGDPRKVMNITNALATYFIDENLRFREVQAIGTSDFLDDELSTMRKRLVEVEQKFKEYREKYMGGLPEQLVSNLTILERLQVQFSDSQKSLLEAKGRLSEIENVIAQKRNIPTVAGEGQYRLDDMINPDQLKAQLVNLKTKYTDRHPDIIRLEKKIADLEAENENQSDGMGYESRPEQSETSTLPMTASMRQRDAIKREIKSIEANISDLIDQINLYQKRVEDTPKREQELLSLKRDYDNIKETYNSLLERKLEAELAVNMEKKQKGEQFRILDSAELPEKPIEPDMKKMFVLILAAGLGLGGGLVFLLEWSDSSVRKPEVMESSLGIRILATVPTVYHLKDKIGTRLNQVLSLFSIMIGFMLFAGFVVLAYKGGDIRFTSKIKENLGQYVSSINELNPFNFDQDASPVDYISIGSENTVQDQSVTSLSQKESAQLNEDDFYNSTAGKKDPEILEEKKMPGQTIEVGKEKTTAHRRLFEKHPRKEKSLF